MMLWGFDLWKLCGIIGLLLISAGVLNRKHKQRDSCFFVGGIFLLIYSVYIWDVVFIVLQIVFIIATGFDIKRKKR